jgi:hypothetical protein
MTLTLAGSISMPSVKTISPRNLVFITLNLDLLISA